MRYAPLTRRLGGETASAWDLHNRAAEDALLDGDVIVMSVGDPDLATPEPIKEAAIAALAADDTHYAPIAGVAALRNAIADRFNADTGLAIMAENVMVLPGAQNALYSTLRCLVGPGDAVVALEPMYVTYDGAVASSGAELVSAPLAAEDGFRLNSAALRAALPANARALLLNTPNNPTGVVNTRAELEAIADIAKEHDLWVISDEVYAACAFERPHISIAALPGMAERTATVSSISKSHAMTGWRLGWTIGPEPLIEHLSLLALSMLYGLPGFVQAAAVEALTRSWGEAGRMRDLYHRRRDVFLSALADTPALACHRPEGGMFALVDVRATGLTAADFAQQLYAQTKVAVLAADPFGPSAVGHIRVSFALDEPRLLEAARRIDGFVRQLEAGAARAAAG
ncbi:MAG: pyridoxal phosphate-dependent aminotransferase [Pseudomonadota bacterium]